MEEKRQTKTVSLADEGTFHASFTVRFMRCECMESKITLQVAGQFLALNSHV